MSATLSALEDPVLQGLRNAVGHDYVLTNKSSRYNRTRVPAPFPVHRWDDYLPDAVVLPGSTEEVAQIVRIANDFGVPLVPRAGGTGLADGAVPLKHGVIVDLKRMDAILEVDLGDRTVTVQPGINLQILNQKLRRHGVFYPDDPASYPCCLVGGRVGTGGWSLIGGRYGHTRDLVLSLEVVLPTGRILRVGEGGVQTKIRKSSTGYRLKDLFIGHQGTLGIATEMTLELAPLPEAEWAGFFHFPSFDEAYLAIGEVTRSGLATLALVSVLDERKVQFLRRDDEAYIPQPPHVRSVVGAALYGTLAEVEAAKKIVMAMTRRCGGKYLGDELSRGDWASRHERYATPLHGRLPNGQVVPMCWHCEDAAIPYSECREVGKKWHAIVDRYAERFGIFDDWGMFLLTNGPHKPWADYLVEIDIGIREEGIDEEGWRAYVAMKRELAKVTLSHGGSITCCHGSTREGDVKLVPREMGEDGFQLMLDIKHMLDPNNIMNPGKNLLDQAYTNDGRR